MKPLLFFLIISTSCLSQYFQVKPDPLYYGEIFLPIYYFPFYDDVQIIEVDYYAQSLEEGARHDMLFPRGGSSLADAIHFNRMNGFLIRNKKGEILANYGVDNLDKLHLVAPDSCQITTHNKRMNKPRYPGYAQSLKDVNGNGYRLAEMINLGQQDEMFESKVAIYGIMDTIGKVVIPICHHSIDFAHGDYLVERYNGNIQNLKTDHLFKDQTKVHEEQRRFAIYDSSFCLTFAGTDIPLKRLAENRFAAISQGNISFMDRDGTVLLQKEYLSLYEAPYGDLLVYTSRSNDTLYQGVLSREFQEITPPVFKSIVPQQYGFLVTDRSNRMGFIDLFGRTLVPCELNAVTIEYRRDHFIVFTQYVEVPNGKMLCSGLIDSNGRILLPSEYWEIGFFYQDIATVKKDNRWGFINRSGEVLCPIQYNGIDQLHRQFIEVYWGNKKGLVDRTGRVILEPDCSDISWYDSLIHYGKGQDSYFILDLRTEEICQHSFGKLIPQVNGVSFYMKGNKYGLVSAQGKLLISAQFDKVWSFRNNLALVQENGKFGCINGEGKVVHPIKYTDHYYDNEGNYLLK